MLSTFKELSKTWAKDFTLDLKAIYEKNNCPSSPGGTTTGYNAMTGIIVEPCDGVDDIEEYNSVIVKLYSTVDVNYTGATIWLTSHATGTKEWELYKAECLILIDDYASEEAFQLFCDQT